MSAVPAPNPQRFTAVASLLAAAGCLVVLIGGLTSSTGAFRGSIVASGTVGFVFAAQNARVLGRRGTPHPAPAVVTAAFGVLFVTAPLLYDAIGPVTTAIVQFGGLLVAAFGGYTAVESISGPLDRTAIRREPDR